MAQEKNIHSVFQVLNFLSSSKLSSSERLVLLELARHKLEKYTPGMREISKNTGLSINPTRKAISSLSDKKIITITNKEKKGFRFSYTINILEKISTGVSLSDTPTIKKISTGVSESDTPSIQKRYTGVSPSDTHIIRNNKIYNKKERERETAQPLALPPTVFFIDNYKPKLQLVELIKARGLDLYVITRKFINHCFIKKIAIETEEIANRRFENFIYSEWEKNTETTRKTTYAGMRDYTQERLNHESISKIK